MKHFLKSLFAAFLWCTLAIVVSAQDKNPTSAEDGKKTISTADAKVISAYDKTKNETTVEFRMLGIANTETEKVVLSVSASFTGKTIVKLPEDVVFILSIASSMRYRFPNVVAMEITADGQELPQVLMLNADKRRLGEEDERNFLETLATRMKYDIFKKLMQAKSVRLRLLDLTLQLGESRMSKMQELDKLLRL